MNKNENFPHTHFLISKKTLYFQKVFLYRVRNVGTKDYNIRNIWSDFSTMFLP